ncbi:unnamed protein product [Arctia plantaginis]|uniref:Uncharacterized protein n=1 Tax=Arctia plantaginis TaxID=874455 RepID=A0A8S1BDD6_ARCPL|nr:unnamed protein product [Arctia plantaginis]
MLRENSRHTATSKGCNSVSKLSLVVVNLGLNSIYKHVSYCECCIYNVCVCDFTAHILTLLATKNHGFIMQKR